LYSTNAWASRGKMHTQTVFYAQVCVPENSGVIIIIQPAEIWANVKGRSETKGVKRKMRERKLTSAEIWG